MCCGGLACRAGAACCPCALLLLDTALARAAAVLCWLLGASCLLRLLLLLLAGAGGGAALPVFRRGVWPAGCFLLPSLPPVPLPSPLPQLAEGCGWHTGCRPPAGEGASATAVCTFPLL